MIGNVVSVLVTIVTRHFQLHTYQRKGASEKVYIRPIEVEYQPPATKVIDGLKQEEYLSKP